LQWLFSRPAVLIWLLLVLTAAHQIYDKADRFWACSGRVLAPGNWLWLLLCWLVLKLVHELAHAVVCKKYGGSIREAGILFVLLTPIAYVDVTSAWRFRSKWQRIFTATAGMYVELGLAAAAALAWSRTDAGRSITCAST